MGFALHGQNVSANERNIESAQKPRQSIKALRSGIARKPSNERQDIDFAFVRNQNVEIIYKKGNLIISAPGRTLANAGINERIRVINLESNKIISAFSQEGGYVLAQ